MPPRLKINVIPYANTPESLMLLSQIAQFCIITTIFSLTVALSNLLTIRTLIISSLLLISSFI